LHCKEGRLYAEGLSKCFDEVLPKTFHNKYPTLGLTLPAGMRVWEMLCELFGF
jgi:hypothetical protein